MGRRDYRPKKARIISFAFGLLADVVTQSSAKVRTRKNRWEVLAQPNRKKPQPEAKRGTTDIKSMLIRFIVAQMVYIFSITNQRRKDMNF